MCVGIYATSLQDPRTLLGQNLQLTHPQIPSNQAQGLVPIPSPPPAPWGGAVSSLTLATVQRVEQRARGQPAMGWGVRVRHPGVCWGASALIAGACRSPGADVELPR